MSVLVLEKGEGSGVRFRFQPKCSKFVTVVLVHLGPKKIIRNFFLPDPQHCHLSNLRK